MTALDHQKLPSVVDTMFKSELLVSNIALRIHMELFWWLCLLLQNSWMKSEFVFDLNITNVVLYLRLFLVYPDCQDESLMSCREGGREGESEHFHEVVGVKVLW